MISPVFTNKEEWKAFLDYIYEKYNDFSYIGTDPAMWIYRFSDRGDMERAGFYASSLALGNVKSMNKFLFSFFSALPKPMSLCGALSYDEILCRIDGLYYRFFDSRMLASLVFATEAMYKRYGSLELWFKHHLCHVSDMRLVLSSMSRELRENMPVDVGIMLPLPESKGTWKRLLLYLRWMIRRDNIDLGLWEGVSPSVLYVPLDVHMQRLCRSAGFLKRKSNDFKAVSEVTDFFRNLCPDDPVRYDFALTRLGMKAEAES
ncbi:TIGR02757 family protein [Spirochaetia bacterium 38H-sp]|uniref:TIGR02757 family protein n=1 Tax=Rarispira pelagica TaxID=3141764 RepID=A0ABU9UFM4_9SPIR